MVGVAIVSFEIPANRAFVLVRLVSSGDETIVRHTIDNGWLLLVCGTTKLTMQQISSSVWPSFLDIYGKALDEYSIKKWTFYKVS